MLVSPFKNSRLERGFTLLEVLITMALIGIAIGVATFQLSSGTRPYEFKNAVKLLNNQANLVQEEAILQGKEFGLRFDVDSTLDDATGQGYELYTYRWLVFDAENSLWQNVPETLGLEPQRVLAGVSLELEVEGVPVVLGAKEKESVVGVLNSVLDDDDESDDELEGGRKKPKSELAPDIYFLSSGELISFKLAMTDRVQEHQPKFQLIGEMVGKLRLLEPGEENFE